MVRTWTLTKILMDPRPHAQLADAVREAPASARGLTDGLRVSGYVPGAFKVGVTRLKNMLIVRTKTTDINLEMELSASEEGDLQYVLQISLWHALQEEGVQVEFAIAASNQ